MFRLTSLVLPAISFILGSALGAALSGNLLGAISVGVAFACFGYLGKREDDQQSRRADIEYAFRYLGLNKYGFHFDMESRVLNEKGNIIGTIVPNQSGVYDPKNFPSVCYAYEGNCHHYVPWHQRFNPPAGKVIRSHDIAGFPSIYHGEPYVVRNEY